MARRGSRINIGPEPMIVDGRMIGIGQIGGIDFQFPSIGKSEPRIETNRCAPPPFCFRQPERTDRDRHTARVFVRADLGATEAARALIEIAIADICAELPRIAIQDDRADIKAYEGKA